MSVCFVSAWLPVQWVNVHPKLKHTRAYTEVAQGTIWNSRAEFWARIDKRQLCEISVVLPEEVSGQLSEKCSATRQGGQAAGPLLELGSYRQWDKFPSHPHLPGLCHTAPEVLNAGNYLWKGHGWILQAYQDRHYVIKPSTGSAQIWERHTAEFFEFSDMHESIRLLWKFLISRDTLADLINIIKLRLK